MKAAKFALVGGIGFAIDGALFYFFMQTDMDTIVARVLAFWLTATFTWLGNKHFTFDCQQSTQLVRQWGRHMISAHFAGVVNLASFYLLNEVYPTWLAFTAGIIIGAVFNYWLSNNFVFRQAQS